MTPNSLVKDVTVEHRTPRLVLFLYIFLLVFEGALRKWVLPSMSSALVLARDPLVLYLVFYGLKRGWLRNAYVHLAFLASFVSLIVALAKDVNWEVAYYGLHSYLLYFPCIFVIPRILSIRDVSRFGVFFLSLSIPVTLLAIIQYASPPNAWVNLGVGGEGSSTFGGVGTFIRPASIFSFVSGLVAFQGLVGLFLSYYLFDASERKKAGIPLWFLLVAFVFYIVMIPVSLSRTNVFQSLVILGWGCAATFKGQKFGKSLLSLFLLGFIGIVLYLNFESYFEILSWRFEAASETEGNVLTGTIGSRLFGSFYQLFEASESFWGEGIGTATAFASTTHGYKLVYWQDAELPRQVYESGLILGFIYILIRLVFAFRLCIQGLKSSTGSAYFFLPSLGFFLVFGAWGNSSILGFTVVTIAFLVKYTNANG